MNLYAGRWLARNDRGDIVGVGETAATARAMAHALRPKERIRVDWITPGAPHLPLPDWLMEHIWPHLPAGRAWLVGGCVRDLLLNRPLHDWDFVVADDGCAVARSLAERIGGSYVPLDVERGIARVVTHAFASSVLTFDFATLRGATLADDLALRDFTINAMALAMDGTFTDLYGGRDDLQAGVVRRVSPQSFVDDPLRMLRAVRIVAELHFKVDEDTAAQMRALAEQILHPAPERVREELLRTLRARPVLPGLDLLRDSTLWTYILPEIAALDSVQQSAPHYQPTVWRHTRAVLVAWEAMLAWLEGRPVSPPADVPEAAWSALERTLAPYQAALLAYLQERLSSDMTRADGVIWGLLFHDVGKALTRSVDAAGRTHFYGHDEQGAELTRLRLSALRFPLDAQTFIADLVRHHMRLIELERHLPLTRRTIYRFFRTTGEAGMGVVLLSLADTLGVWGPHLNKTSWQAHLDVTRALCEAYFERAEALVAPTPLLNGHDLMAMGIPAGPRLGELLAALREAQAAGEVTNREQAEAYVRALVA